MKLSKIKINPSNPRIIKDEKFKKLVKSIKDFPEMMEKRPMVCVTDADGLLYPIGGNMRLKALIELKYKEIPDSWVVLADDWSEEQRKEFIIKDNVSFGEFDWDTLANEWNVEELSKWGVDIPFSEMTQENIDSKYNNKNCEYPLIPIYDEKYSAFIIICKTATEEAGIRTKFNFPYKAKSYKNKFLGESNVLNASELL
ncbi:MAG: ParB N-terminal domain-containing protein [Erysipelotrichia bacterium]|nr:ParB N-terminal domain-containing protein [Erysipelotrichia bacterium]